jgi:hypothetical protein
MVFNISSATTLGHIRTMYLEKSKGNAMNACLSDEFESDHSKDSKGKNVIYMAFPTILKSFGCPPLVTLLCRPAIVMNDN